MYKQVMSIPVQYCYPPNSSDGCCGDHSRHTVVNREVKIDDVYGKRVREGYTRAVATRSRTRNRTRCLVKIVRATCSVFLGIKHVFLKTENNDRPNTVFTERMVKCWTYRTEKDEF